MSSRLDDEYDDEFEDMTVGELFEEELELLIQQHQYLEDKNTEASRIAANSLLHVINYFRIRIGLEKGVELEDLYGTGPDTPIH
jgi:hypothetical protein